MEVPRFPPRGAHRPPSRATEDQVGNPADDPPVHVVELPTTREASGMARRWLVALAAECGLVREVLDDAVLVLSELVANVVDHTHTRPVMRLEASCTARWIRIGVLDHSHEEPVLCTPGVGDLRGRGMLLVNRLARRWGIQPNQHGKRVWAELALT